MRWQAECNVDATGIVGFSATGRTIPLAAFGEEYSAACLAVCSAADGEFEEHVSPIISQDDRLEVGVS